MKKLVVAVAAVIVLIGVMSRSATAVGTTVVTHFHGSICRTPTGSSIDYSQWGVHNTNPGFGGSGGGATVFCPAPLGASTSASTSLTTILKYYDRGATLRVSCTHQIVDQNGSVFASETLTSPSGAIGSGVQTFSFQSVFINPLEHRLYVTCNIPPSNAGWNSHIAGFQTNVQFP
jgi:hypothetical protein